MATFPLTTSQFMYNKYGKNVLAWDSQVTNICSNPKYTDVSYGVAGSSATPHIFTKQSFLDAINNNKFIPKEFKGSTYVVISFNDLVVSPPPSIMLPTLSTRVPSTTPGVEYEIMKIGSAYGIKRYGKTRTSILKPQFDTETQAKNYLVSACNGVI